MDHFNVKSATIGVTAVIVAGVFIIFAFAYTKMTQPEILDPKVYEKQIENQLKVVNSQICIVKKKHKNIESLFSVLKSKLSNSLNEAEPVITENSIKAYFNDDIHKTIKAIKFKETETVTKEEKSSPKDADLELESGDFFTYLKTDKELIREKTNVKSGIQAQTAKNEVKIKQVGLRLRSQEVEAAIYQIKNVFKKPGSIANLFYIKPTATGSIEFDPFTIDFRSEEDFLSHFRAKTQSLSLDAERGTTTSKYNYITIKFDDKLNGISDEVISAITPDIIEQVDEINPYKWLYLATFFNDKSQISTPLIVLLYRKNPNPETDHKINYPKDVNLFDKKTMAKVDKALFVGCTKRILNHCRDFLSPNEKIVI